MEYFDFQVYSLRHAKKMQKPICDSFPSWCRADQQEIKAFLQLSIEQRDVLWRPPPSPRQPLLHKGSNPTIKVLIKGTDTLYWRSKSSLSQSAQRWMVYCHLFVVRWSPAQGCHRFLISLRFQLRCLISYFANVSLCTGWNMQNQINAWKTSAHSRLSVAATHECSMKMWWAE